MLVAPLDWGLGHATRCIPIISHLQYLGCKVIIAAEGLHEVLLKKEFPHLTFVKLPGYRVNYSRSKRLFALKIILQFGKIVKAVRYEHQWLKQFVETNNVQAVISDNRYGFYHSAIPSVIITHQLSILAPFRPVERLMQKLTYRYLNKFSRCWVPDQSGKVNVAGKLAHPDVLPKVDVQYIGCLSRLQSKSATVKYEATIILSGPEPSRSIFEQLIVSQLNQTHAKICLVRGLPGVKTCLIVPSHVDVYNYCTGEQLQALMHQSNYIVSRSGYTSIMDICMLQKKAVLVPTPGQTEQEYLGKHLHHQQWCMLQQQQGFKLGKVLQQVAQFNFKLPHLQTDMYKGAIEEWLKSITAQGTTA